MAAAAASSDFRCSPLEFASKGSVSEAETMIPASAVEYIATCIWRRTISKQGAVAVLLPRVQHLLQQHADHEGSCLCLPTEIVKPIGSSQA